MGYCDSFGKERDPSKFKTEYITAKLGHLMFYIVSSRNERHRSDMIVAAGLS